MNDLLEQTIELTQKVFPAGILIPNKYPLRKGVIVLSAPDFAQSLIRNEITVPEAFMANPLASNAVDHENQGKDY